MLTALLFSPVVMAQKDPPVYRKMGPVYLVNNPDKSQSILSIAEFKNSTGKSWHYFLRLHSVLDNKEINKKEIAVSHNKPINHEQLIGRLGNTFFVVTDSLVGYDEHTLEPSLTESILIAANPFMKDKISRHHNNYLLDEAASVMYLRDEDGGSYKLYAGSPVLKPDNGMNEAAPDDHNYETAANYKLYDRYDIQRALTCIDTAENNLYILGSEKETGSVLSYFGTSIFPEREENRQLTVVPYQADGASLDYKINPPKTGEGKYFKAGFLQNRFCTTAWKNKQGERIISFQTNTIKPMFCVALVDKNGKEKWRLNTGRPVNTFIDYLVSERNLLLWFDRPDIQNNTFITTVFTIDLQTGSINQEPADKM